MNMRDFAYDYPSKRMPSANDNQPPMVIAERWNIKFGEHLRDMLRGKTQDPFNLDPYIEWLNTDYIDLEAGLFRTEGDVDIMDQTKERLDKLNFHTLNSNMLPLWVTDHLTTDTVKEKNKRIESIILAQGNLALSAVRLYKYRDSIIKSGVYEKPEYEPMRGMIQGRLTELDASVAVLGLMKTKYPYYNLYAAPAQFEHSTNATNNVDLILTDPTEDEVVGIQVKSRVNDDDFELYDKDKIVLIDGVVDLGGQRLVRIDRRNSPKLHSWGGMVAVSHLRDMPRQEKQLYIEAMKIDEKYFYGQVFLSRALLAGIKSHNQTAIKNVDDRITHYFSQQKAA